MKVLLIYAHPDNESLHFGIYRKVYEGLFDAGHKVDKLNLYDHKLDFKRENQKKDALIENIQKKLMESDGLIFIYPVWWYGMPAILKNLIDRVFEKDFAFTSETKKVKIPLIKKEINTNKKTGMLSHIKKVLVINTADSNKFIRTFKYRDNSFSSLKNGVLKVVGVKKIANKVFTPINNLSDDQSAKILDESYRLGKEF